MPGLQPGRACSRGPLRPDQTIGSKLRSQNAPAAAETAWNGVKVSQAVLLADFVYFVVFFLAENLEWLVKHWNLMINVSPGISPLSLYVPYGSWLASIVTIFASHFFLDALSQRTLQFRLHAGKMKLFHHGALWQPNVYSQEPPTTMKLNHRYTPKLANSSLVRICQIPS
jgi:hypothetical protein